MKEDRTRHMMSEGSRSGSIHADRSEHGNHENEATTYTPRFTFRKFQRAAEEQRADKVTVNVSDSAFSHMKVEFQDK